MLDLSKYNRNGEYKIVMSSESHLLKIVGNRLRKEVAFLFVLVALSLGVSHQLLAFI